MYVCMCLCLCDTLRPDAVRVVCPRQRGGAGRGWAGRGGAGRGGARRGGTPPGLISRQLQSCATPHSTPAPCYTLPSLSASPLVPITPSPACLFS